MSRLWLSVVLAMLVLGCGPPESGREELLVSAASSLSDVFAAMEAAFEETHPGTDVVLNLAASSQLREQVLGGAPVDVVATAGSPVMDHLASEGDLEGRPRLFALTHLQIAVPEGNPAGVRGLGDFSDDELLIGLCAEGVPCGDYSRQMLRDAGVAPAIDTDEPNARALLAKIEQGELDAGIVYATDVMAAGGSVEAVEAPGASTVTADYRIAPLADAPSPGRAEQFVAFVLSATGRAILADHGFETP